MIRVNISHYHLERLYDIIKTGEFSNVYMVINQGMIERLEVLEAYTLNYKIIYKRC
jgi:hypothetical protein